MQNTTSTIKSEFLTSLFGGTVLGVLSLGIQFHIGYYKPVSLAIMAGSILFGTILGMVAFKIKKQYIFFATNIGALIIFTVYTIVRLWPLFFSTGSKDTMFATIGLKYTFLTVITVATIAALFSLFTVFLSNLKKFKL